MIDTHASSFFEVIELSDSQPFKDLLDADRATWTLLKLGLEKRDDRITTAIINEFNLPDESISALLDCTNEELLRLSSGMLSSFQIQGDEQEYINALNSLETGATTFSQSSDTAYWLAMNKIASVSTVLAAQAFGVSVGLAEVVKNTSMVKLTQMHSIKPISISLRFEPSVIAEILNAHESVLPTLQMKKYQQALLSRSSK